MPAKRRPPFEMEPGEGKAHEAAESPEEETREGSEEQEGENYPTKSRKRSARGAKRTKAPMDAEGGCCNEKKGKAPCAACAAGKACGGAKADGDVGSRSGGGCVSGPGTRLASSCSRGDALTPWEYLDACDLGIQDRSRAYIRARLDAEQRLDAGVKCGGGYIAAGKKCRNGAGGGAPAGGGAAPKKGGRLKTLAKVAGAAALIGAAAYGASRTSIGQRAQKEGLAMTLKRIRYAPANAAGRRRMAKINNAPLPKAKSVWEQTHVGPGPRTGGSYKIGNPWAEEMASPPVPKAASKWIARTAKKRRDSVWAAGFTTDSNLLAI